MTSVAGNATTPVYTVGLRTMANGSTRVTPVDPTQKIQYITKLVSTGENYYEVRVEPTYTGSALFNTMPGESGVRHQGGRRHLRVLHGERNRPPDKPRKHRPVGTVIAGDRRCRCLFERAAESGRKRLNTDEKNPKHQDADDAVGALSCTMETACDPDRSRTRPAGRDEPTDEVQHRLVAVTPDRRSFGLAGLATITAARGRWPSTRR